MGGGGGRNSALQSFQSFPSALPFPALILLTIYISIFYMSIFPYIFTLQLCIFYSALPPLL